MLRSNTKRLALCSLAVAISSVGQITYAHTTIADSPTEGQSLFTAFSVPHGCQDPDRSEDLLPVIAQAALFPNNADAAAFKIDPDTGEEIPIILDEYVTPAVGGPLLGPRMVQNKDVFAKQETIVVDATDEELQFIRHGTTRIRGFRYTKGNLDTGATGYIPFRVTTPSFNELLDDGTPNCAKSLKVRIPIVNWCSKSNNEDKDNRADAWIGHTTEAFNDEDVVSASSNFWPTMTIHRNAANPLDDSCGEGYDIAVQPSSADIDQNLRIKGYWPR